MAGPQSVWGIDIGRSALKALKLRAAPEGKVEIVAHEHIEHAKILSQPDADRHALIGAALERFLSHNDLSKDHVVVSVPGQHTLARFTKLPPVQPKRIPDIVRYEAEQQIPFDMDEVIWDYHTFQQEGLPDVEVGIFAMKRELIREHLLHFEQAGIEPIAVQSGPLAVYNMAHFDGLLAKETTILLDVGAENTDLIIATPDSLWTRTVAIGGNSFTEALVKSFKLSFAKAENLKRTAATSKYARQIFQAMRPVFADLVQELQRSIGYYSTNRAGTKVEKVVCVGNAFLLPGLQKYLQQNLGMPVEKPESFKNALSSAVTAQDAFREQILGYIAAYGLALQGLDLTKVTSNLLPTEIAKQVVWRKKRPAFAAAAACLVLAGGLIWFRQAADSRALAAGGEGTVSVSEAQAGNIIENGPPASYSSRQQAKAILDAANLLKKQLSAKAGQGQTERAESEKLIELQGHKAVVLGILDAIHSSVPKPDGPLAGASTPAEVQDALANGASPRPQRKQVFIESFNMQYEPDLRETNWDSQVEVDPPINPHDVDKGSKLPGFLLKIACTTPNEGGMKFIKDSFMDVLRQNGRKPGTGFYIDNMALVQGGKVEAGAAPGPRPAAPRPAPSRGAPPKPGAPAPIVAAPVNPDRVDLVTNELTDNDWRFEIWAGVILEDFADAGKEKEPPPPPKGAKPPPAKPKKGP
jgi:type IV pilus assembly protein PilM